MSHEIKIQISDGAFEQLRMIAGSVGRPVEAVAAERVESGLQALDSQPNTKGSQQKRFRDFFGMVSMPDAAGLDNEQIDAELAREYGNADEH